MKKDETIVHADTQLARIGRSFQHIHGFINPPVIHASTVLFKNSEMLEKEAQSFVYGRHGTPTSQSFAEALCVLEEAKGVVLAPSGLSAITVACLSCLSAGDHFLVVDSVYAPVRRFCEGVLARLGIETSFYDPSDSTEISDLFRPNTRAILFESPGSLTFEIQDIPKLVEIAKARDLITLMDNTWATPLYFRPLAYGVDLSIQAGTKYISGHSDVMIGSVASGPATWPALEKTRRLLGLHVGPDDVYLALRGLRSLGVRLARHQTSALQIASWLEKRADVTRVLYPALPSHPGHALWKRDFSGATSVFSFAPLCNASPRGHRRKIHAFLNALQLFGLGYSWGGFESLALRATPQGRYFREAQTSEQGLSELIRLHIGLEHPEDLMRDLERGFSAFHKQSE